MRFGKRSKNPLSWGRRGNNAVEEPPKEVVHAEEPEPPIESAQPEPPPLEDLPEEVSVHVPESRPMTSDPTQRLLTSLGRFQRQFMKAREGAPQSQWSDECMNHLIHGVEIALEQEWGDLVEALTETGRVLQTYEDAGRANDCEPFLSDSYEILCLMVGDLIVDKIRSGVMRKWRDRYEAALDELAAQGLTLVEDGDDGGHRRVQFRDAAPAAVAPPPQDLDAEGSFGNDREPFESEEQFSPQPPPLTGEKAVVSVDSGPGELGLDANEEENLSPASSSLGHEESILEMDTLESPFDTSSELSTSEGETPEDTAFPPELPAETTKPQSAQGLDRVMVELLDTLCDGLARIEGDPHGDPSTVFLAIKDGLASLETRARQSDWDGSVTACQAMTKLFDAASHQTGNLGDRFFEIAYAFGGIYGETQAQSDDPALTNWIAELESLLDSWTGGIETPGLGQPAKTTETEEMPFELPPLDEEPLGEALGEVPSLDDSAWRAEPPELPTDFEAESPDIFKEPEREEEAETPAEPDTSLMGSAPDEAKNEDLVIIGPGDAQSDRADLEGDFDRPDVAVQAAPETSEDGAAAGAPSSEFIEISSADRESPADQAASQVSPEEDPASLFLDTARKAVASGAPADAKLFAMQAAASIARAQAKDAEAKVRQAEIRLQETVKSLENARQHVQDAEVRVTEAEAEVEEGTEALSERGRHTHGVLGSLDGILARITDLDRRIQELQAQREEAVRQQGAAEDALTEAREQEDHVKAHLDSLKNAEQAARVRLEDARGQVKVLQRKQSEIEAIMERARDSLTRYRESMADIEETIELIRSAETGPNREGDELLF